MSGVFKTSGLCKRRVRGSGFRGQPRLYPGFPNPGFRRMFPCRVAGDSGRQGRIHPGLAAAILLAALLVAALFWMVRRASRVPVAAPRQGGMTASVAPSAPSTTVEQAEQQRRQQIAGRMEDPAYRKQLDAVAVRRQKLAEEAQALQGEIADWQQAAATTNASFAAAIEAWANGRQAADTGDAAAAAALPGQAAAIEKRMAADGRGAGLLARRRELESRRGALDEEARRLVGERIRRQIARPAAQRLDAAKAEVAE